MSILGLCTESKLSLRLRTYRSLRGFPLAALPACLHFSPCRRRAAASMRLLLLCRQGPVQCCKAGVEKRLHPCQGRAMQQEAQARRAWA